MAIELKPEIEAKLHQKVTEGSYPSVSDLVEAALAALNRDEFHREQLRQMVNQGLEDLEAGRYRELDPNGISAIFDSVRQRDSKQE